MPLSGPSTVSTLPATAFGTRSFTYSSENLLLTGPSSTTLSYDPQLRLYQMVSGGVTTRMAYDGVDRIAEYNGSNALQRRYVHGPGVDEPILWYEGTGTSDRRFLSSDERGSIISLTDSAGALININKYDEFGCPQSTNLGTFGYTGQARIATIGAWYYKARIYDDELGRFLQTDPIGTEGGINLYAYVGNDPVNWVDPWGEDPAGCIGKTEKDPEKCEVIIVMGKKLKEPGEGAGGDVVVAAPSSRPVPRGAPPASGRPGGGPRTGGRRGSASEPQGEELACPAVPAEVPRYLYGDPGVFTQASFAREAARVASAARYPNLLGVDDERDAFRHVFGAAMLARGVGGSRALGGLNGNEFQGFLRGMVGYAGYTAASRRMDDHNNYVGVALADDPRFAGMSPEQLADFAVRNGCLVTSP